MTNMVYYHFKPGGVTLVQAKQAAMRQVSAWRWRRVKHSLAQSSVWERLTAVNEHLWSQQWDL